MHPDKSKLDKSYFIFFSKAYKLLYSIYEFKHKNQTACPTKYTDIVNEGDTAAKSQLVQFNLLIMTIFLIISIRRLKKTI